MSSELHGVFTKDRLDFYLKALAKEYRRLNGTSVPAEIILIGGAAVLAGYRFREMTADVDAVIYAASSMKEAINRVGDQFGLPNGWLNGDFMRTGSYSPKLAEFSVYYKTFSNVLQIRTISAEYLIAMKLCSGRKFRNDLSDVIGILAEHEANGTPISQEAIDTAVQNLYGGWEAISEEAKAFLENALRDKNYVSAYASVREDEARARDMLIDFARDYPAAVTEANVNEILSALKARGAGNEKT